MDTLISIKKQSFRDWECLIIDDDSEDATKDVLQGLLTSDKRFKYFRRPNYHKKGLPGSRNYGLERAEGDYIIFFDDDDYVHPENLKINLQLLEGKPKYQFCRYEKQAFFGNQFDLEQISIQDKIKTQEVNISDISQVIEGKLPFASCTVLWAKECFVDNKFNEDLQYAEEWELYSRILTTGALGISINKVLYFNRKHPESNTGEFWAKNQSRLDSKVKAARLIIKNLKSKGMLSKGLIQYFIRLSIFLKRPDLLKFTLNISKVPFYVKLKYLVGYKFYPFLRPVFLIKDKLLKLSSQI